jgi:hypothetical protein
MTMADLCAKIPAWQERYPDPAAAERNAESRAAEDRWLARFDGADALDRGQVQEMIDWKFATMPHRRAQAMKGIAPDRWDGRDGAPGAAGLIRQALATPDDYEALALTAASGGGIHRFGPAMGSVLLAACRPGRFTVADSRALAALRHLGLMPPGGPSFQLRDWLPYLDACRGLASRCGASLRAVDRALWIAAVEAGLPARSGGPAARRVGQAAAPGRGTDRGERRGSGTERQGRARGRVEQGPGQGIGARARAGGGAGHDLRPDRGRPARRRRGDPR